MLLTNLFRKKKHVNRNYLKNRKDDLKSVFNVRVKSKEIYNVVFETLDENEAPVIITQSEFMRRMKDMSQMGGGMNFYGELPDSYNLVVNPNHQIVIKYLKIFRLRKELSLLKTILRERGLKRRLPLWKRSIRRRKQMR